MAFVVPMLAVIGGGSAAAGAAVVVSAASGVMSAVGARNAGIAQSNEMKYQAYTEGLAAKQREIDRRRDLMTALSSQNAAAGAGGIELGGSFGGIIRKNIKDNQNDLMVDAAGVSARRQALLAAAKNAKSQGNMQAATSLLDTAGKVYGQLGPVKH